MLSNGRYPNTDAAGWREITPEDATPAELHLVYQIMGERPKWLSPEQWRDNMRACAKSIRRHRAEVPELPEFISTLLTKWDTVAADERWNGHVRMGVAGCAKDLREAIGSKPSA